MLALEEQIPLLQPHMSKLYPICHVDVEIFHWICKTFVLLGLLKEIYGLIDPQISVPHLPVGVEIPCVQRGRLTERK